MNKEITTIPKPVRIIMLILFFFLIYLLYFIIMLFISKNGVINITEAQYLLIGGAIGIVFFVAGLLTCSLLKAWDIQSFIDRVENSYSGRQMIYLLYDKFIKLNWKWVDIEIYESTERKKNGKTNKS